jgi:hypothetical protein
MVPLRAPDCIWQRELEEWTDLEGLLYHGSRESRELMHRYEFYLEPELGTISSSSSEVAISSSSSALRAAPPPLPPAATSLMDPMELAHAVAAAAYHQQQQQQQPMTAPIPKPSVPTTALNPTPSAPTTAPVPRPRGRAPSGSTGVPMVWCSRTGRWESLRVHADCRLIAS